VSIATCQLYAYRLPVTEPVFVRGHRLEQREGLLIHLISDTGHEGWGDIAPLPGFSRETLAEAQQQARLACTRLEGRGYEDDQNLLDSLLPSVRFGFDSANMMMGADFHQTNPGEWLGGETSTVSLSALLTGSTDACVAAARRAVTREYETFKLKVGQGTVEEQVERIRQVRDVLPGNAALRLDANRAWSLETACAIAKALPDFRPAYVEEPLADIAQLTAFHASTGWDLALDETLHGLKPDQPLPDIQGVVAWVFKPTLVGALNDICEWQRRAHWAKKVAIISAAYESGVGIRMLAEIASRAEEWAAGLDTYRFLAADVFEPRMDIDFGWIELHDVRTLLVQPTHLKRVA
jgi:O-succinylbenzoate synthase